MINIEWDKIETKGKHSGQIKSKCPACIDTRSNKNDKSLSVNLNEGIAYCHYCNGVSVRDEQEHTTYELPKQDWKNFTTLSDKLVKWCEETRKISQKTLKDLGITEEKYYQPAKQKEVQNLVFNYFEGSKLVNKKYRSGDKKFTQSKGTKSIFYNINSAIGKDEVYIVEGEFDVLALYEIGIKNVISVPNGANDNDEYFKTSEPYLTDVKKFIIATDKDKKGIELREKIAQRLGRYRCEYIEWNGKDANDDLISGVLNQTAYKKIKFPVSGTFTVDDLHGGILDLYEHGLPKTIYPKSKDFGELKQIFSTMRGHLVVGTGIPSHGKSNFTEWYVLNLINDHNLKASFFSPEHTPMELHQTTFIQKTFGKNFWKEMDGVPRITKDEIEQYKDWANEKLYLTSPDGTEVPTWDWLFDKFKEQMFRYGIDIFVIDAFNKLVLPNGVARDEINRVITKLTAFAQQNNVIIFLIAHPTKMRKNESGNYEVPTLYDVSGSADFRNQTKDGFCIYRNFGNDQGLEDYTTFINLKTKFSFQGEIGKRVDFNYHIPSGRYYPKNGVVSLRSLIDGKENTETITELKITPNISFDVEEDETPF